jgi:membrane fusion protein, multidrug efflux system
MSMKPAGKPRRPFRGKIISIAIIAIGVAAAIYVEHRISIYPSTDDATIDADVVHVAAAVGGRIIELPVTENAKVSKGDLLFRIDPVPYRLAVEQAEADLGVAAGALDTRRRAIVSLQETRQQEVASLQAVGTEEAAVAAVQARQAALAIARRALEDTVVRAWHDGRVVGLTVLSGEMVVPSQALFTLISTDEWYAVANFRETDLHAIAVGDCATVFSMIDRSQPIKGVVEGIGWGVLDEERINLPRSVPYVQRSMNWVRVAQRFPVRVRLENPPEHLMRLGASAVVEVKHGDACS